MARLIVITSESTWLVTTSEDGLPLAVVSRASFGEHMPNQHNYVGNIITGPDGVNLRPGTRLVFRCQCDGSHDGWSDNVVTSGSIKRVVHMDDLPVEPTSPGFIRLNIGWSALLPFVTGGPEVQEQARNAFEVADLLATLKDMGRVTDADIRDAQKRARGVR